MKKEHIKLSEIDESYLTTLISKGQQKARVFQRATALLQLHEGETIKAVAKSLKVTSKTVTAWRDNYLESGLEGLDDKARSGRPIEFDGNLRAKITALACSRAPQGHAKWSLTLLADKAVELNYCEQLSRSTVNKILKKMSSSRI
jgi:transposase